ncbi:hypothetical protein CNMCM5623_007514 [Aspergillus felis]|uniref:Carrier domain-containing protein n=1 Tax=Aspergillus felis TaxID=1287682 RepID=A0A8H6UHW8_9EURO|nr:hypothetical protein CNMCM5623_007514 [Aspergillus felis]KAF7181532.1 hypothetical protein CNMCM7691_000751 [Aspergillus felis]
MKSRSQVDSDPPKPGELKVEICFQNLHQTSGGAFAFLYFNTCEEPAVPLKHCQHTMPADVSELVPALGAEVYQNSASKNSPVVTVIPVELNNSETDQQKQQQESPLHQSTTCKPLPFARSELPARQSSWRYLFEPLESQSVGQIKEICLQTQASQWHFISAALQSFIFRYTDDDGALLLLKVEHELSTEVVPPVSWTSIQFGQCAEKKMVDLLAHINQISKGTSNRVSSACGPLDGIRSSKDTSSLPSAQVAVNYRVQHSASAHQSRAGSIYDSPSLDVHTQWGIQLHVFETPGGGVQVRLDYSPSQYTSTVMELFFGNFLTFLVNVANAPSQPLDSIPMCGAKEIARLKKHYWNTNFTPNPWGGLGICQQILGQAQRNPDAVAVMTLDGANLTYSELVDEAQRVAGCLHASGVASDSDFAPERLATIAADCGASVIVFEPELQELANDLHADSDTHPKLINILEARQFGDRASVLQPQTNDAFYMIYTSGSTGTPKGVVLSQGNTRQMLASLSQYFHLSPDDRFLQQSSLAFDLSVVQVFSALCAGAQVCVATAELRKDPWRLASFMQQVCITVSYFTPTHFALLLENNPTALRQCLHYRVAMFAGERLPVRLVKTFYDLTIPGVVYNTWSPSELVVQTTIHKVDKPLKGLTNIPIGSPLPNCRHYVVDDALNPLPAGLVGEICVGGAQVGMGYLNRPDANARSFIQDPFCSQEDRARGWSTLFRTGDKGRFLPGGLLEFHGRIEGDKQTKLRGFRIDLGEVEQALYQRSKMGTGQGIVDIAVIARPVAEKAESASLTDNRQLIAFVVPRIPLRTTKEQTEYTTFLHQNVQPVLNQYMLPNGYQFLSKLPTTIGGKVDQQALLRMKLALAHPYGTPCSDKSLGPSSAHVDIVNDVIELMKSVVGQDRSVTPASNFFHVGGQSILLLRLRSKLNKRFGVAPPLQEMFSECTPLVLARTVSSLRAVKEGGGGREYVNSSKAVDWSHETALPTSQAYLKFDQLSRFRRPEVTNILLTGADTFIGIHMLAKVLTTGPNALVHLLGTMHAIQAPSLIADMQKYRLFRDGLTPTNVLSRIKIVPGSMAARNFGLSDQSFRDLATSIHAIYNLAVEVSLLKTYQALKAINTDGVRTLIALASSSASGRVPEIHHLSTWSIPHMQTWQLSTRSRANVSTVEESPAHFSPPATDEHGYLKSRWAAEMILTEAANRGLLVSIYRASAVSGSLITEVAAPSLDFVNNMIMHMVQHCLVPDISSSCLNGGGFVIDFVPVDILTDAIVHLASEETIFNPRLSVYHLGSSQPLPLNQLPPIIPAIREDGAAQGSPRAPTVPIKEWLSVVRDGAGEQEQLYWTVVEEYLQHGHIMFALDRGRAVSALRRAGWAMEFPKIDADYLQRLWGQTMLERRE